jgi:hypothetical protein
MKIRESVADGERIIPSTKNWKADLGKKSEGGRRRENY